MADSQDGALDSAEEVVIADAPADDIQGGGDAEEKARVRGWKPEAEFTGPKDKWVSAEEFLRRGEDEPALLKANLKRLEAKLETQAKTIREFAEFASKSEQRAYERAVRDLEARQAEAVAAGDVGAVKAITREMTELATEAKAGAPAVDDADVVDDFIARNAWYTDSDPAKEAAQLWAQALCNKLANEGKTPKQQLAEVERRVKTQFPNLFTNPRRDEPGAVEGRTPTPRKMVKSYDNLPPDAKAACDRFVRDKLITREDYVKSFEW